MTGEKQLWILAGGNGAGKSTFFRSHLERKGISFINADIMVAQLYPDSRERHSYEAALIASQMRLQLLQQGRTFCFETVFSHPSKLDFTALAKTLGYEIILVFIHLSNTALNQARVAQRVQQGGHNVPAEKVGSRIPRTLEWTRQTLPLCDHVYILDNSKADNPFQQLAVIHSGSLEILSETLPDWASSLLIDYVN